MGKTHKNTEEVSKQPKKVPLTNAEMTDSEKKKKQQENKAKANPEQAARNKEESDRKREKRKESGSVKKLG